MISPTPDNAKFSFMVNQMPVNRKIGKEKERNYGVLLILIKLSKNSIKKLKSFRLKIRKEG